MKKYWDVAINNKGLIKNFLEKNMWIIDKSYTLDYEDYLQIGLITLYNAAVHFQPGKRKFSTYAWICLKWNLTRAFRCQAFPIMRVPESQHPKKEVDLSAMTFQESFTYNVLNYRFDLSATDYLTTAGDNADQNSDMFVFFE